MAMISRLEALSVSGPSRSMPSAKMVGNMIELNRPMAITLTMAMWPWVSMLVTSSAPATTEKNASSLRGFSQASRNEPSNRPTMAPPQ